MRDMKTILMAVASLNGMIARRDGSYDWASKEDKEAFFAVYKKAGCIIIGRNTYEARKNIPGFPNPACICLVLTHRPFQSDKPNLNPITATPREAFAFLEARGFTSVVIGGGGQINTEFLREGLVDEIILDVEPITLGRGISLFAPEDMQTKLKLLSVTKLNMSTLQIHYKVLK